MTTICSNPQCSSTDSSELRKLPLGPGRWDGSVTVCPGCYLKRNQFQTEFGNSPLPDWEKLAVVKEKQNCDLTDISGLSKHTDS